MARFKVKLKATAIRDPKQDHPTYRIVDPIEWFEFFGAGGITKRRSLFESKSDDGEFKPAKMTKGICLQRQTPPTPQNLKGIPAVSVVIVCDAKHLEQLEHDRLNIEIISAEPVSDDAQLGLVEDEKRHETVPLDASSQSKDKRTGRSI
jgi:hypothetical protein